MTVTDTPYFNDGIDYSINHPELKEGEILIANIKELEIREINFKTKRMGIIAYNIWNKPIHGLRPIFVKK